MAKLVRSDELMEALAGAGVIPERTRRVVIDMQVGHVPVLHVEQYGDESLLQVMHAMGEMDVYRFDAPAKEPAEEEEGTPSE